MSHEPKKFPLEIQEVAPERTLRSMRPKRRPSATTWELAVIFSQAAPRRENTVTNAVADDAAQTKKVYSQSGEACPGIPRDITPSMTISQ